MDDHFVFNSPPECPVFRPNKEEFKDPLEYIEQISPIAVKTGICKIIPPDDWKPPFSVNVNTFQFTPRVQKLYELEAQSRIKLNFMTKLSQFVRLQGSDKLKVPNINGKHLDLYKLHKTVLENGGYDHVTVNKLWPKVAGQMNYKIYSHIYSLKSHYEKIILPYERMIETSNAAAQFYNTSIEKPKPVLHPSTTKKRKSLNADAMEIKVQSNELKRLQFKGAGPKTFVTTKEEAVEAEMLSGPLKRKCLSDIICKFCGSGDKEERLLICDNEGCQECYHCDCLNPPLQQVPKQSWKCQNCILKVLTKKPVEYGFPSSSITYTLYEFGKSADRFKANYFGKELHELIPCHLVEKEFWRILQSFNDDVIVEYGADIHSSHQGSGFPTFSSIENGKCARNNGEVNWEMAKKYSSELWNLNNLPINKKSILRFIRGNIDGMKVPWCYVGMIFSSFCWHIEDHWSYSINYLHWGEPKTWYGVSSENADLFEGAMRRQAPELFENHEDLLHHITTIMNPNILMKEGVPIFRTDQHAGQFVITFPRAYHAGFNQGFNFAEAVNFCPANWLPKGRECIEHYAQLHRHCVFAHEELLCTIAEASLIEQDDTKIISMEKYPLMFGLGLSIDEIKLDTNIRRTVHAELEIIIEFEKANRKKVDKIGIKKSRCTMFENMTDDERACSMCQSTCFLSAVECLCINDDLKITDNENKEDQKICKIYCLRHLNDLCGICSTGDVTFCYRFTIRQLENLLSGLEIRLQDFHSWENEVKSHCTEFKDSIINGKSKWSIEYLQSILIEGSQCGFETCEVYIRAKALLERGKNLIAVCKHWLRQLQNPDQTPEPLANVPKSVLIDCQHKDGTIEIRNINVGTLTEENLGHMVQTIKSFPVSLSCDDFVQMVDRLLLWRNDSHVLLESACNSDPGQLLPQVVKLFDEAKSLFPGWASFTCERTCLMLLGKSLQWLIRIRECEDAVKSSKISTLQESVDNISLPITLVKESTLSDLVNHGDRLLKSIRETIELEELGNKYLLPICNLLSSALNSLLKVSKDVEDIKTELNKLPKRCLSGPVLQQMKTIRDKCLSHGIRIKEFDDFRVKIYKMCIEIVLNPRLGKLIDLQNAIKVLDIGSALFNEGILDKGSSTLTQKHVAAKSQVTLVNRSIRKLKQAFTGCASDHEGTCPVGCSDEVFLRCLLPRYFSNDVELNQKLLAKNQSEYQDSWISSNPTDGQIISLMRLYQSMIVAELTSIDSVVQATKSRGKDRVYCRVCRGEMNNLNDEQFCELCLPRTKRPTINEIAQLNKLLKQCSSVVSIFGIALQALSKRTVTWLESLVALFRIHMPYLSKLYQKTKDKKINIPVCVKELFSQNVVYSGKPDKAHLKDLLSNLMYLQRVGYCVEVNVDAYINVINSFIELIQQENIDIEDINIPVYKTDSRESEQIVSLDIV